MLAASSNANTSLCFSCGFATVLRLVSDYLFTTVTVESTVLPHSSLTFFRIALRSEYHLNNDIALLAYQYYAGTQNKTWLEEEGWPIVSAVAEFWAGHVVYNTTTDRYDTFNET